MLVNNAGTDRFAFFVHTDEALWDHVLGVNLRGTIAATHAVLEGMQRRGAGAIVNVASEAGRVGSQGSAVYSAAKAGVIGFTRAVARESSRLGVRVNAVAPGPIETPLLTAAPEQLGEIGERLVHGMIAATSMRRIGQPRGRGSDRVPGLRRRVVRHRQTLNVSGASRWPDPKITGVRVAIREDRPRDGSRTSPRWCRPTRRCGSRAAAAEQLKRLEVHELRACRT